MRNDASMDTENGVAAIAAAIDRAEEIRDPLDGLIEKTRVNPSAPFEPETLERLMTLKAENPAAFRTLRAELAKTDCRLTELDDALSDDGSDEGGRKRSQATILVGLAASAQLFHASDGTGFADITINGHRETWPIRSKGFKRWLLKRFLDGTERAPGSEALQSALNVLEARAHFDAPELAVHIRVGELGGRLYLDLCDPSWRAVEIDAAGWRVIENPPVRFRRTAGMKPLPMPARGGSIDELRSFLNVQTDGEFVLAVAWVLACLRNRGPYPVLVVSGEQGSAKSTFTAMLRALIDPNTAPLRALPREDRDLFIAANNGHLLAFDNISNVPPGISDTLCRLASGGGIAVRQLYTDQDEVLFDAARPIVLNGIEEVVTRHDLADRAVFVTLSPIPEERRRPEADLWAAFQSAHARILGVLLDAVVEGLKQLPHTRLERLPRMADFALWGTACETALWPAGTFGAAYRDNRDEAVDSVIEADPVAAAVRAFMSTRPLWKGIASELHNELGRSVAECITKSRSWPTTASALSNRLSRAAPFLRNCGIQIEKHREGRGRNRMIFITKALPSAPTENPGARPSAPSASFAAPQKPNPANDFAPVSLRTAANDQDGDRPRSARTVRTNPLFDKAATEADGADDVHHPLSGSTQTAWRARI